MWHSLDNGCLVWATLLGSIRKPKETLPLVTMVCHFKIQCKDRRIQRTWNMPVNATMGNLYHTFRSHIFLQIQKYQNIIDFYNPDMFDKRFVMPLLRLCRVKSPVPLILHTHSPHSPLFVSVSLCLWSDLACNLPWRWALITDISPERGYCIVGVSPPFIPSVGALGKVTLHITHCLVNQWANLRLMCVCMHKAVCVRDMCVYSSVCVYVFSLRPQVNLSALKHPDFHLDSN